jgi:hypothetical protein
MSALWESDSTVIDCVRIKSRGGDPDQARQKIGRLLANADLRPSRLPTSSILCLRKLRDPAPEVRWEHERVRPPLTWEQSVTKELDRLTAAAVRPALAPVPPTAQAVLFLDRAELLACLTADWLQGTVTLNWWWFTLLKSGAAEQVIVREWTESPQLAPAAMAWLAEGKSLGEFVRRLPEEAARRLLENVRRAFAVPVGDFGPVMQTLPVARSAEIAASANCVTKEFARLQAPKVVAAPAREHALCGETPQAAPWGQESKRGESPAWLGVVPEASEPRLSILKRVLIAQALMLHRAPARARAATFQKALEEWRQWAEAHTNVVVEELEAPVEHPTEISAGPVRRAGIAASLVTGGEPVNSELAAIALNGPTIAEPIELPPNISNLAQLSAERAAVASGIESDFAGVMFMLNVSLYLKLYADFTAPLTPGLELNPWDFVYLLGREFVGEKMENDPMSGLLRTLAGREESEAPGVHFEPPAEWVIPLSWLDPFPEPFVPTEIVREGRVQMVHPAGFVISDKPLALGSPVSLPRWLSWISGYVRARLARAVGREDAAELLCRIPGRITCTSTHVDVHYSLKTYPIEIRLAGLDRDPGWVPSAGRYVAYHFQ